MQEAEKLKEHVEAMAEYETMDLELRSGPLLEVRPGPAPDPPPPPPPPPPPLQTRDF